MTDLYPLYKSIFMRVLMARKIPRGQQLDIYVASLLQKYYEKRDEMADPNLNTLYGLIKCTRQHMVFRSMFVEIMQWTPETEIYDEMNENEKMECLNQYKETYDMHEKVINACIAMARIKFNAHPTNFDIPHPENTPMMYY